MIEEIFKELTFFFFFLVIIFVAIATIDEKR